MYRYKLTIEYDGSNFAGWQRQKYIATIQEAIENAFFKFLKVPTTIYGSSRTDSGVHAIHQVAHVDIKKQYSPKSIQGAVNHYLGNLRIGILKVENVCFNFHARFSAAYRCYEYIILSRKTRPTFTAQKVWWIPYILDQEKMQKAAQYLTGYQNFSSFRNSMCQATSPMKTLDLLNVKRQGDYIIISAKSRSFLHSQVRNMVGTLRLIGDGSWHPSIIKKILRAKNRCAAGPTAPPNGLYLSKISF